jgi:hypothetical protein
VVAARRATLEHEAAAALAELAEAAASDGRTLLARAPMDAAGRRRPR